MQHLYIIGVGMVVEISLDCLYRWHDLLHDETINKHSSTTDCDSFL